MTSLAVGPEAISGIADSRRPFVRGFRNITRMKSGADLLVSLVLLAAGSGVCATGLKQRAAERDCRAWPRVQGEIVRVDGMDGRNWRDQQPRGPVTLTLKITVAGREWEVRETLSERAARADRRRLHPGHRTPWCYPPGQPERGRLGPSPAAGQWALILLGGVVALVGLVRGVIGLVGKEVEGR